MMKKSSIFITRCSMEVIWNFWKMNNIILVSKLMKNINAGRFLKVGYRYLTNILMMISVWNKGEICLVNWIHIKDNNGNYRVRVDVPDKHTPYNHIHILDENGNPLDINGNIVSPKDPAGHIPYKY